MSTLQFSLSAGEVGNSSVNIYNTEIMELIVKIPLSYDPINTYIL